MASTHSENRYAIYLEVGTTKVFACATEWPGWSRSGPDEASAIQALINYAPRYAHIIKTTGLAFPLPHQAPEFMITERIAGNYATNYGVPDLLLPTDANPLNEHEVSRSIDILKAAWQAFDKAVQSAEGKELRKGPRGGGRELDEIVVHVANAEMGYLRRLGGGKLLVRDKKPNQLISIVHDELIKGIHEASLGHMPAQGPHGGKIWPLRYFIRRVAWHVVDHAWEIEDRVM